MNARKSLFIVIPLLLLGGCNFSNGASSDLSSYTSATTESVPTSSEIDVHNIPINFTAINDFHGQLDPNKSEYEVGISKMASYLKYRKNAGDILISSGDMYQGSLISNITKGKWVSEMFKYIGFDAYVIGNHEFDWGIEAIKENEEVLGEKMLGANIYQYPQVDGKWVKSDIGEPYKIITVNEGSEAEVKVGIIGVIGVDQLSSITSLFVKDIVFLEPDEIVKTIAVDLRENKGCDVVVASYHSASFGDEGDADPDPSIADIVPGKNYHYVDACFMAHTHRYMDYKENGVPFIQASAYSRGVADAQFTFDKATSTLTLKNSGYHYLDSMDLSDDTYVKESLEALKGEHASKFTDIIGTNTSGEINTDNMSRLYAKISFEKAIDEGYSIDGCLFNSSRQPLKDGNFTYSDLYETNPFLNDLYIFDVSGSDFRRIAGTYYGIGYLRDGLEKYSIDTSQRYKVLAFNYNGFHQNINSDYSRQYNVFPSAFTTQAEAPVKLDYNCVEATVDYLKINHNITLEWYSGSNFV